MQGLGNYLVEILFSVLFLLGRVFENGSINHLSLPTDSLTRGNCLCSILCASQAGPKVSQALPGDEQPYYILTKWSCMLCMDGYLGIIMLHSMHNVYLGIKFIQYQLLRMWGRKYRRCLWPKCYGREKSCSIIFKCRPQICCYI